MISLHGNRSLSAPHGFTLTELLTVMALLALIGTLGAGAYQAAKRNYSLVASAGRIQALIQAARNTSIATGSPSFVIVDPVTRTVSAHAFERVGEWSFDEPEGDLSTTLSSRSYVNHGASPVPGKIGKALSFRSGGAYADCGAEARFDLRTGVLLEAWVQHDLTKPVKPSAEDRGGKRVRLESARGAVRTETAAAIVRKEGAYFLGMTPSGALEGAVGEYRARTVDGVVLPGRWVHVALRFDGKELELSVDGVPRPTRGARSGGPLTPGKEETLPRVAPVTPAPVTISAPDLPFPGEMDEVRISGNVEPLLYEYAPAEHIVGWKKIIHFDRLGHLDPRFHSEGVRLVLVELSDEKGEGTQKTIVATDYSLTFEEWLSRWDAPPLIRQRVEEAKLEETYGKARRVAMEVDRLGVVK